MLFAKYEYIRELESEKEALARIVNDVNGKAVFKREKNGKDYYFEILKQKGRRRPRAIFDKELGESYYRQYAKIRFAKKRLQQIEKELNFLHTDSEMLRRQLILEYKQLEKLPEVLQPVQDFKVEGLIYETLRGEKVRSKSEAMIADALYRHGVSYQYEKVLKEDGVTRVDFTIENNIRGRTLYWEHFGRMDDPDYVLEYLKKKKRYESMGIIEGRNLIVTYEFYVGGKPYLHFDTRQAESVVLKYFDVPAGGL